MMQTATISEQPFRVLVIDDNSSIHEDFKKILMKTKTPNNDFDELDSVLFGSVPAAGDSTSFEIDCALQGRDGLDLVMKSEEEKRPYSLAFVDGRMPPGWDGVETIRRLWGASPALQVILCTAYADYSWQEINRELGETDNFLILKKPFDKLEVLQLTHTLTRKWALNNEIQSKLNKLAFFDSLTGLPNRTLFIDRCQQCIYNAARYQNKAALLYIDLDNFKRINDTLGHSIGDKLLKVTSRRLVKCLRNSDCIARASAETLLHDKCDAGNEFEKTLEEMKLLTKGNLKTAGSKNEKSLENQSTTMAARLGGDEFTVILPLVGKDEYAGCVAQRIIDQLSLPMQLGPHEIQVTPSVGIAIYPDNGEDIGSLLKNADMAMYVSKRKVAGSFSYFRQSMNAGALERLNIEKQLRYALEKKEFFLNFQPQFDLLTQDMSGLEVLIRWENRELGMVPPDLFISIAEENGMITQIGRWVMKTACVQAKQWLDAGLQLRRIAVNVSVNQFTHHGFLSTVRQILQETGLGAHYLEIEITESLIAKQYSSINKTLHALKEMGIQIALDDFGVGYSSLSRLKELPFDCLKIDRSFVSSIDKAHGQRDKAIVKATIAMAEGLGVRLVAEGVETPEQADFLRKNHCKDVQGYLFSRPVGAKEIETLLKNKTSLS